MASNFSGIPIRWLLTVDSEMAFQTGKFHLKNRYCTHLFMIHAISVFSVKFTVDSTSYAMKFSTEQSKENDLIIKAATENIKTRAIHNLLFSLTLRAVRINNQGALPLGLAKSIYYS